MTRLEFQWTRYFYRQKFNVTIRDGDGRWANLIVMTHLLLQNPRDTSVLHTCNPSMKPTGHGPMREKARISLPVTESDNVIFTQKGFRPKRRSPEAVNIDGVAPLFSYNHTALLFGHQKENSQQSLQCLTQHMQPYWLNSTLYQTRIMPRSQLFFSE